jgi:hypothetical protein
MIPCKHHSVHAPVYVLAYLCICIHVHARMLLAHIHREQTHILHALPMIQTAVHGHGHTCGLGHGHCLEQGHYGGRIIYLNI